jgi:hypothetical protein
MGDRANVCIKSHDGHVFLYTHWHGHELAEIVHAALAKRWRWGDSGYLRRIVFCAMIKGHEDGETGYGIGASLGDNEHPIIVLDDQALTVGLAEEETPLTPYKTVTYEEFVADVNCLGYD